MSLLDRIDARRRRGGERRSSIDSWISDYLIPASFSYNGQSYLYGGLGQQLNQTLAGNRAAAISQTLPGYTAALLKCPPAFAAQMVRALVLCQAKFVFRTLPYASMTPRRSGSRSHTGIKIYGTQELSILERPWPKATSTELIAMMEWHSGLAGNAYVARQPARDGRPARLRVLRPDWTAVIWGSKSDPDSEFAGYALDSELLGYVYFLGGVGSGNPSLLLPDEVAHWHPLPDPLSPGMGMSWLTPALRDVAGDQVMTEHKLKYFENGASPNLVIKGLPAATQEQFNAIVDMLEERHAGAGNAYKTLYLTGGADATIVGSDLSDADFKSIQGASETRISFLSRVPAPILGIAEGLQGSALNAGNFQQARRVFADTWVYPMLHDLSNALAAIVPVSSDSELWFDTDDIPLLREDAQAAAEIVSTQATTIRTLVDGGYDPQSVVDAVMAQDMHMLQHTGKLSVQLQEPGSTFVPPSSPSLNGKANGTVPV